MSASIFISYATADSKVANTLCKALESRGFQCWISSRDVQPGDNFQVSIVRAIRGARMMLLVFTGASNNSEEMTKELVLASQHRLIVVPLRIEDVTPNEAFAYEFATRQWIDFFADWEAAMDQLSLRISSAIGADPAMLAAAAPAAEAAHPPGSGAAAPPAAEAAKALEPAPVAAAAAPAASLVEPKPAPEPVKAEVAKPEPLGLEPAKIEPAAASAAAQALAKAPAPAAKGPAPVPPKPVAAPSAAARAPGPPPKTGAAAPTEAKKGSPVALIVGAVVVLGALAAGAAVMLPSMLAPKAALPPPKPAAIVLKPAAPAPVPTPAVNAAASLVPVAAPSLAASPDASNALASAATNALAPTHAVHKRPKAAAAHAASASEVPF